VLCGFAILCFFSWLGSDYLSQREAEARRTQRRIDDFFFACFAALHSSAVVLAMKEYLNAEGSRGAEGAEGIKLTM
jgi:hypothetical protein